MSLNQKNRLIEAFAVLLKSEIKGTVRKEKGEYYSFFNKLDINETLSYISSLIPLFCSNFFTGKEVNNKVASIGHSTIHAIRIRVVISLLQFALHCVKSVQIRNFFWPVFSRSRTEYGEIRSKWYWVFSPNAGKYEPEKTPYRIQSECGKIRSRKSSVSGHFSRSACSSNSWHFRSKYMTFMVSIKNHE